MARVMRRKKGRTWKKVRALRPQIRADLWTDCGGGSEPSQLLKKQDSKFHTFEAMVLPFLPHCLFDGVSTGIHCTGE